MPALIQQLLNGNFSSPLTWVFVIFTLLAFYFLFRLAWVFFVQGDSFTESVEGRRQVSNIVRTLIICVAVGCVQENSSTPGGLCPRSTFLALRQD